MITYTKVSYKLMQLHDCIRTYGLKCISDKICLPFFQSVFWLKLTNLPRSLLKGTFQLVLNSWLSYHSYCYYIFKVLKSLFLNLQLLTSLNTIQKAKINATSQEWFPDVLFAITLWSLWCNRKKHIFICTPNSKLNNLIFSFEHANPSLGSPLQQTVVKLSWWDAFLGSQLWHQAERTKGAEGVHLQYIHLAFLSHPTAMLCIWR